MHPTPRDGGVDEQALYSCPDHCIFGLENALFANVKDWDASGGEAHGMSLSGAFRSPPNVTHCDAKVTEGGVSEKPF